MSSSLPSTASRPPVSTGSPPPPPPMRAPVRRGGRGFAAKLILVALVNALGLYVILRAWQVDSYGVLAGMLVLLGVVDYAYFSARAVPLKYLIPGLAFLLVFQVFTIVYTGYVAFTNYGHGHNSTKQDAVAALLIQSERRVEGSPPLPLSVVERTGTGLLGGGGLGFAVLEDGRVLVGTSSDPLAPAADAVVRGGQVVAVPGWRVLDRAEILSRQQEITQVRVPTEQGATSASIRTQDARTGYLYRATLAYNAAADTMTDLDTGTVYRPNAQGQFEAADGSTLGVGWRVPVGLDNFTAAFADARYAQPFLAVLIWTFVFAVVSVGGTFLIGFFFASAFNHPALKGRRVIRSILILPYAFPAFMSFLLWRGMLNTDFGFINQVLLGGADIPWLTNPWMARLAVLIVEMWVGFPYMFLICTGALQSIPTEVYEAARIDGASGWRIWRSITLPLLLVAVSPLLIASFSFNFNNFNIIEMVTAGGPRFPDASVPVGATDILITMVYSISGLDGRAPVNYGLASALSLVIFLIVAVVSVVSFKRSQSFEEIS